MPDNNDIDQAIQSAVNSILKSVKSGQAVSDAQLRVFLNAVGKAEDGANQAASGFRQVASASQTTANAMLGFAGQLGRGNTAFSVVNTAIRGVTDSLGSFARMIPLVGDGIAGLVGQVGKAAEFSVEQIEAGYNTFGELSNIGLIGSKGIKGLAKDFSDAGIPLKTYSAILSNSSKQLAMLNGTAHDVSQTFASSIGQMREETQKGINGIDNQLRLLGYSTEDISQTFINYADLQRRLGREQSFNSQTLKDGTMAYAKELDLIAKLTGMSRKEQQKVVEAAMAESRWRATVMELGEEQKLQMDTLNNGLSAFSGELAQGMRDQASGFTQSEAAQRLFRSTAGQSAKIMQQLTAGQITGHQALIMFQDAIRGNMEPMTALAKATGNQAGVYTDYSKNVDFVNASIKELGDATKTQAKQTADPDKLTQGAVGAVVALEDTSTKIAAMFMDSENAAQALRGFADATNAAAEAAYNLFLTGGENRHPATIRQATRTELTGKSLEKRLADIKEELDVLTDWQLLPYSMATPTATFSKDQGRVAELIKEMETVSNQIDETNALIKSEEKERVSKLTDLNSIFKEYGLEFGSGGFSGTAYVANIEGERRSRILGKGSEYASVKGVTDVQAGEIRRLLDETQRTGFELTKDAVANQELWKQVSDLIVRPEVDYDPTRTGIQNKPSEQFLKNQTDAFNTMNNKLDTIAKNTDSLVRSSNSTKQIIANKG